MAGMTSNRPQDFKYLFILDFEATCSNTGEIPKDCQEIIEFPVLALNTTTGSIDHRFHHYVRPVLCPQLTAFCTELTGITQKMVDNQLPIEEVLRRFDQWLNETGVISSSFAFVTCGDWDLKTMLPSEARRKGLDLPEYFGRWINVKKSYEHVTRVWPKGMMEMLQGMGLPHKGRHHSGIDDTENISEIVKMLCRHGYHFRVTGRK